MTTTRVTDQIIALAVHAGLAPHSRRPWRGAVEVIVDGTGTEAPFGAIVVGARTGRVLRAVIQYGNHGPTRHYTGAVAVRRALRDITAPPA